MTHYPPRTTRMLGGSRRQPPPWPIWAIIGFLLFTNIVMFVMLVTDDDGGGDDVAAGDTTLPEDTSETTSPLDASTTTSTSPTTAAAASGPIAAITASLQQDLADLGYYDGPVDGVFSDATEEAVREFQSDQGLAVDGRYGPETHDAMVAALGDAGSETIVKVQEALATQGYYTGEIDGIYGDGTVAAVRAAQEDLGVTADGIVGPETITAWEAAFGTGGAAASDGATVTLEAGDGLDVTLDVTICDSSGPSDLTLTAQSDDGEFGLEATSGSGTAIYDGSDGRREGDVQAVAVSDEGEIDAVGTLSAADGSGESSTFTLVGTCG